MSTCQELLYDTREFIKEPYGKLEAYAAGKAAVVITDATVTGTTTDWLNRVTAGSSFQISPNQYYTVRSVTDATHLELMKAYEEVTAGTQTYEISNGFWQNAEIIRYMNNEAAHLIQVVSDEDDTYFGTTQTVSYASGTQEVAFTTALRKANLVIRTDLAEDKVLYPIPYQYKNLYSSGVSGRNVKEYYYLYGNKIGFVPTPDESATNNITISYSPLHTAMEGETDESIVPPEFHELISLGAARRCMIKKKEPFPNLTELYRDLRAKLIDTVREGRQTQAPRTIAYISDEPDFIDTVPR